MRRAVCKGHSAALYLMNVLRARLQYLMKMGVGVIPADTYKGNVSSLWTSDNIVACREEVLDVLQDVRWIKWKAIDAHYVKPCMKSGCRKETGWDGYINSCCYECIWINEHFKICRTMRL